MEGLSSPHRRFADFKRPVFPAVAFALVCREKKFKIDLQKLIELSGAPAEEFHKVKASMEELCSLKRISTETSTTDTAKPKSASKIETENRHKKKKKMDNTKKKSILYFSGALFLISMLWLTGMNDVLAEKRKKDEEDEESDLEGEELAPGVEVRISQGGGQQNLLFVRLVDFLLVVTGSRIEKIQKEIEGGRLQSVERQNFGFTRKATRVGRTCHEKAEAIYVIICEKSAIT
jgi:hypothetical protein